MGFFACPYTLFNVSIEAVGVYVSHLMKRLFTDPRYSRVPDCKCRHYQALCNRMEVYVSWYVPPFFDGDTTLHLMAHVSMCYTELIGDRLKGNLRRSSSLCP